MRKGSNLFLLRRSKKILILLITVAKLNCVMFSCTSTYERGTSTLSLLTREEQEYMIFKEAVPLKTVHTQNLFLYNNLF